MTSPQHSKISNEEPVGTFGVDANNNVRDGKNIYAFQSTVTLSSEVDHDSHVPGQNGLAGWNQECLDAARSDLSQGFRAEPCRCDHVPWSQTAITVNPRTGLSFSQDLNLSWLQTDLATKTLFNNADSPFDYVFDQDPLQLSTLAMQGYDSARAPTPLAFNIDPNAASTSTEDVLIAPAATHFQEGVGSFGRHVYEHVLEPTQGAHSGIYLESSSTSPVQGRSSNNTNTHLNAAQAIHCPHGCPKPLHRAGDYRRHMRKHQKPRYKCPDIDCDKTFYRADKMRDHIRQGHKGLRL